VPPGFARLAGLFSAERRLAMAWEIERAGRRSTLVGLAPFFPYRFQRSLRPHIAAARELLVEGPVDEQAVRTLAARGASAPSAPSLLELLDPATVLKVNAELRAPTPALGLYLLSQQLAGRLPADLAGVAVKGMKPWMAFLSVWTHYLAQSGWSCRLDSDAHELARALGKPVRYLETIEEQIAALEQVPPERIVRFMSQADWTSYRRDYARCYLSGDLEALVARAEVFPTFCEPVIGRRARVLRERLEPHLAAGGVLALIGALNCARLLELLAQDGYRARKIGLR
jgi:hypothetical protein